MEPIKHITECGKPPLFEHHGNTLPVKMRVTPGYGVRITVDADGPALSVELVE